MKKTFLLFLLFTAFSNCGIFACSVDVIYNGVQLFITDDIEKLEGNFVSDFPEGDQNDSQGIISEWREYFKNSVPDENIEKMVFGAATSAEEIQKDSGNALDNDTLQYLVFIKSQNTQQPAQERSEKKKSVWDYVTNFFKKKKTEKPAAVVETPAPNNTAQKKELNIFLQERYAYNNMKVMLDAEADPKSIIAIYDEYFQSSKSPVIKYWAEMLCADAFFRDGQKDKALEKYLDVYNNLATYRKTVRKRLGWNFSEGELKDLYGKISIPALKSTLACLMNDAEKMYETAPLSPRTRETFYKKVEELSYSYLYYYIGNILFKKDIKLDQDQRSSYAENTKSALQGEMNELIKYSKLIMDMPQEKQARSTWELIYGYLLILGGNSKDAEKYLALSADGFKGNETAMKQINIFMAFNALTAGNDIKSETVQKKLEAALAGYDKIVFEQNSGRYIFVGDSREGDIGTSLLVLAAQKYIAAGDYARAAACYKGSYYYDYGNFLIDIYTKPEETSNFIAFVENKNPQYMDAYLLKNFSLSIDDLHYITSMKYVREGKFNEAYAEIKKIKNQLYWVKEAQFTYDDWDTSGIHSKYLNVTFDGVNFEEISKKEIIEKLAGYSADIKDKEKKSANLAKIAFVLFSNDLSGYSDILWKGDFVFFRKYLIYYSEEYNYSYGAWPMNYAIPVSDTSAVMRDFLDIKSNYRAASVKYFEEAKKLTKNKELAAKYLSYQMETRPLYGDDLKNSEWFKELKGKYASTDFYKEFSSKCSYIMEAIK